MSKDENHYCVGLVLKAGRGEDHPNYSEIEECGLPATWEVNWLISEAEQESQRVPREITGSGPMCDSHLRGVYRYGKPGQTTVADLTGVQVNRTTEVGLSL